MPAQFDLLSFSEQAQQFCFVMPKKLRFGARSLLRSICCPHPDDRIVAPKTLDEFGKAPRRPQDELHDFVGAPDRPAIASPEQNGNRLARHSCLWEEASM